MSSTFVAVLVHFTDKLHQVYRDATEAERRDGQMGGACHKVSHQSRIPWSLPVQLKHVFAQFTRYQLDMEIQHINMEC